MSLVENIRYPLSDFYVEVKSWEIPDRGITALRGVNGSGKTTLIRILVGLEPCKDWRWRFGKLDLATLSPQQRRMGVCFQKGALFPHLSVRENVFFPCKARGCDRKKSEKQFDHIAKKLQLEEWMSRPSHVLSGGEAQRVALARAFMGEPRMIILDEPFSFLDKELKNSARELVKELVEELKIPCLMVSHEEADLSHADCVFRMERGYLT